MEKFSQFLQNMTVKFMQNRKELWKQYQDTCVYACNTTCNEYTRYSSFELIFGRKPILPIDVEQNDPDNVLNEFQQLRSLSPSHIDKAMSKHKQVLQAAMANIASA